MIDSFVNAVKKGDTAVFGGAKATVLANSNVLMHKEVCARSVARSCASWRV